MKISRYKLFTVSGGIAHYAEVTVECIEKFASGEVRVGTEAFSWLKEVYGPNAWEWPECGGYRLAAIRGVQYALAHSSSPVESTSLVITVAKIDASPVDTTDSSVAFAACYATWQALQLTPAAEPRFEGRNIVFPE